MDSNTGRPSSPDLQFDRVETESAAAPQDAPAVHCSGCKTVLTSRYFAVNGAPVCARCQTSVEQHAVRSRSKRLFARAALFGLGASILGAAIYYAVIALTGLEIGIIAILTGYLVGRAVRQGARGHGRRRFQLLALSLTYFSVGLAYTPVVMKEIMTRDRAASASGAAHAGAKTSTAPVATADSGAPDASATQSAPASGVPAVPAAVAPRASAPVAPRRATPDHPNILLALAMVLGMVFALPVIVIVGSMPGGLLSALIIGIGMRQAWMMTAGRPIEITGPFRIGGGAAPAPA